MFDTLICVFFLALVHSMYARVCTSGFTHSLNLCFLYVICMCVCVYMRSPGAQYTSLMFNIHILVSLFYFFFFFFRLILSALKFIHYFVFLFIVNCFSLHMPFTFVSFHFAKKEYRSICCFSFIKEAENGKQMNKEILSQKNRCLIVSVEREREREGSELYRCGNSGRK